MKNYTRGLWLWVFLALVILLAFAVVGQESRGKTQELEFPQLVQHVEQGRIKTLTIRGQQISGELDNDSKFKAVGPRDDAWLLQLLESNDVVPSFEPEPTGGLLALLTTVLPVLLLFVVFLVFMRQMNQGNGRAMTFGKSRARLLNEHGKRVTFDDVAGADEAKEELQEIIQFLRDPRRFTRLGGRIPKGVLLMGPPGTGKTLLARAVAGEAGVPFFSISGSDFVEMFVGVGASRVRDLFEQGKRQAPCIIFVDEIDAVGRHRGAGTGGGHDEREQTLNQLLVEMDGFESNDGVILMAATNRPDVLDPALLRPGRFDRRVVVGNPDLRGRIGILEVHTRRTPLADDVDLETIGKATPGLSGADLENLVNEAALLAARKDRQRITMGDFEDARDKVSMGVERRSMVIPEKERRRTAYHEAGHAIVARLLPHSDAVHKVTIVPRGRALGVTQMVPSEDRLGATLDELRTRLCIFMGGRAAEQLILGELSTGASNDLQQATRLARAMVTQYGMSEAVGPMAIDEQGEIFLGRDLGRIQEHSQETARVVDKEVQRLLTEAYDLAVRVLDQNQHILERLARLLLDEETVEGEQFERVVVDLEPVYPVPRPA
ncbi:MAG: ATP-dependent metallopeptidase FtsH/Yme1/Tma family protein [Alphaproteobacteria bacterium]|nr:ATP-dependent metallopeptidase FtsH/Yme1/Tma family protein [Alphaproteobacteria bacterium]